MKRVLLLLTLVFFAACLVLPFVFFHSGMAAGTFRNALVAVSLGYFVFATMVATRRRT